MRKEDIIAAYKLTFGTETGKAVLAHLKEQAGVDSVMLPSFGPLPDDRQLLVKAAMRDFVVRIEDLVRANPDVPSRPETSTT